MAVQRAAVIHSRYDRRNPDAIAGPARARGPAALYLPVICMRAEKIPAR
jgi:hypothetical protein